MRVHVAGLCLLLAAGCAAAQNFPNRPITLINAFVRELGIDVVTYSPYGIVGPAGMDPKIVKIPHDAFRKALDDPGHVKTLAQLSRAYCYKSSEDYTKWAAETYQRERALIERLGLLAN